ncbi:MAG: hypothetical protein IPO92_10540 [Saprospiraceae bacterium]|nr:hypothetical protein [Saprospiraceae bacterium]
MKHINIALFLLFVISASGQKALKPNQFEGYTISFDGVRTDGIIEIADINQPWDFQEKVKFFDKSLLAHSRIKREDKIVVTPGEIVEYGINGKRYVHVHYYVKSKGEDNIFKSTLGKIKDEKITDFFAEVYKDGKISWMKFYLPPTISEEDEDSEETMKEYIETSLATYEILVSKEGEKPKSLEDINVGDFFSDCELIGKKYSEGKYKMKPNKSIKKI